METKTKPIIIIIVIFIFDLITNILVQLLPDNFRRVITMLSENIGISYSIFWLIITSVIVITTLFLILKQKKEKTSKVEILERQRNSDGRVVNQYGEKSIYIEKNDSNITIN